VQPYPGPGLRRLVGEQQVWYAVWRGDGREILYVAGGDLYAVSVADSSGALRLGTPEKLFSGLREAAGTVVRSQPLAVSRDGERIYWLQGSEQPDTDMIHVRTRAIR
jgi:hypothetical protein